MLVTNFQGGEISRTLFGRVDSPLYGVSVSKLENFTIIPHGGISKRSGSERIGSLKAHARLIPFIVNTSLSFIFEIGDGYIRIWKNGRLLTLAGYPVEFLATDGLPLYTKAEARELHYAQTHNALYLTQKNHKPSVITWHGGDVFTFAALSITGNAHTLPFQGVENYPSCTAFFAGRLFFAHTAREPQKIWASKVFDYGNFTYFDTVVSRSKQLKPPDVRVFSAKAVKDSTTLTAVTKDFTGIGDITRYYVSGHKGIPKGTKVLSVTRETMTLSNAVTESKEDMGLSIHLWKEAGNPSSEDYQDIEIINNVTAADHAFDFELGSDKNDAIKWLTPSKDLIIGTESSEWVLPEGVTAQQIQVRLQSRYGVASFQGMLAASSVFYIGHGGRTVRDYVYDYATHSYQSIDLTAAAAHLLAESAAVDFDYSTSPRPCVFVTREDGTVLRLVYDRMTGLSAWSRISLASGQVKSTVCVPAQNGFDEVYFEVEHKGRYYLERLRQAGQVYLDGFTVFTRETVQDEYEGACVFIPDEQRCVALSELPPAYLTFEKRLYIGYPYTARVVSLPVINSTEHNNKRIVKLSIRFLDSYLPRVSQEGTEEQVFYEQEPFSGAVPIAVQGNFERDVFFTITADKALPCTVLAVHALLA